MTFKFNNIIKLFFREERKFYFFIKSTAGYWPGNVELFREALTHKSANKKQHGQSVDNERLEYLGDAILDMLVAERIFMTHKDADEGNMTRVRSNMVSRNTLDHIAVELNLDKHILRGSGVSTTETHLPGNALEAFVAAIYIDGGMDKVKKFVRKHIASEDMIENAFSDAEDYKSKLLQWAHAKRKTITFETNYVGKNNDGHYIFTSSVYIRDNDAPESSIQEIGKGDGSSKKTSEQRASRVAITELNII